MRRSRALLTAAVTAGLTLTPMAAVSAAPAQDSPSVLSWGAGRTGQLGNGDRADSSRPVPVKTLFRGDVDRISAGGTASTDSFALALTEKTVKSWGHNASGQLGNGSRTSQSVPTTVPRLANIKDVAAGGEHALAMNENGQVYSWGDNTYGQLGSGRTGDARAVPSRVQGLARVKQVSAGCDFSLALLENGKVYAWGRGVYGALGNGTRATVSTPREVEGLENVTDIDAGCHHALALTADRTVKSWGHNAYGQLGDSSTKSSVLPVDVDWLSGVNDIEAGANHNYAITDEGIVWGWGSNKNNQLLQTEAPAGANPNANPNADRNDADADADAVVNADAKAPRTNRTVPVEIPRLEGAQQIAAGANHGIAIFGDDVFAWGHNNEGQLGDRTTTSRVDAVATLNAKSPVENVAASLGGNTSYAY
ncbi:sialidase [Streptomyces sp. IB2014 016-6]|uniref:RCC1 domain-containing protein n=1 Tax=Streptomyces sp. IB2014 016-6 TaxID=2517818 RepID=UPI0011C88FED|nr:sialidase [Streptomyces sp. IB2014 016-6]TXL91383.1 sialidase [Streptomyces sp. IB2014 016-6]